MSKTFLFLVSYFLFLISSFSQEKRIFTHADTLRGSITPERAWWNVLRYDITVKPDYASKTIQGNVVIDFTSEKSGNQVMQIDLQNPLKIDSVIFKNERITINKIDSNVYYFLLSDVHQKAYYTTKEGKKGFITNNITIYYHGAPHEAVRPPWDGGWIWKKDSLGRPWMSVACQTIGASVWYPCKDHQSDEPDNGASLSVIVPDTLMAVGNGRLA